MIRVSRLLADRGYLTVAALSFLLLPHVACGQSGSALPVPEFFGIYAATDGHLVKLDGKEIRADRTVSVRMGQRQSVGGVLNGAPVASSQPATVPAFAPDVKIVVFAQTGGVISPLQVAEPLRIEPLIFVRNVSVDTGFPNNVRRSGLENGWEYGSAPEMLGIAVGDHPEALELLKKPFPGHNDMVIAGFAEPLKPGVYRFTLQPGDALFGGGAYFTFAVEPIGQAEAAKCADATVTYAMAVSNMKFRARGPSAQPVSDSEPRSGVAGAGCGEYRACMNAGNSAIQSSNWPEALTDFQAAASKEPESGGPWMNIGRAYVALGRSGEFSAAWDKAIRLGQPLGIDACHEKALQPCERGILWLGPKEISFMVLSSQQKIFSGSPAEVSVKRQTNHAGQGHVSLTVAANGKNYQLDFLPAGMQCEVTVFVDCSGDGSARQTAISNYVAATIPKLASGQLSQP